MSKYAGQKVRYVGATINGKFTNGNIYESIDRRYGIDWVSVVADDEGNPNGSDCLYFELVEPEIKVGDKVRCTKDYHGQFTAGKIYEVRRISGAMLSVVEDDVGRKTNGWGADNFELVTDSVSVTPSAPTPPLVTNTPHIVAAVQSWGISPAQRPHVHANSNLANTEARRLAEANPGVEFAIYARVSGYRADKPVAQEVA
jgi:hypothetical protein